MRQVVGSTTTDHPNKFFLDRDHNDHGSHLNRDIDCVHLAR
jgi:hypothetical protein